MAILEEMKICCTCKDPKPIAQFFKNKSRKDGLSPYCKGCGGDHQSASRSRHPERIQAEEQDRYLRDRDRILERQRGYYHDDPTSKLRGAARYRARKHAAFIEDVDPRVVYEMHGGMCGICKEFIEGDFHVDHTLPLSKGGLHCYANVQPAHPKCNLSKGARYG